jgi:hypothetical protein
MVTPLRVPRRHQSGFAKISNLDDESFRELIAALWKIPSTISFDALSSAVAATVDTIAVTDVEEIVPAALFLHQIREALEQPSSEVAASVTLGMKEVASSSLRLSSERQDDFKARLMELLDIARLGIIAKAGGLSVESERSLAETRILTDIRPIFEPSEPGGRPTGAVIIHTLKVRFRTENESKSIFITLTADDVRELSEQLERADAKAESLKSVLEAAQVPHIDSE